MTAAWRLIVAHVSDDVCKRIKPKLSRQRERRRERRGSRVGPFPEALSPSHLTVPQTQRPTEAPRPSVPPSLRPELHLK